MEIKFSKLETIGENKVTGKYIEEDEYEKSQHKTYKKKEKPKQGIKPEFDLSAWEKEKANQRRANKHKDKEKHDRFEDWN